MNKNVKVLFGLGLVAFIVGAAAMMPVNTSSALAVGGYGYGCDGSYGYGYGCTPTTDDEPGFVDPGTQGRNPIYGWTISCDDDDCDVFFTIIYGRDPDGTESTTKAENNGSDSVVCYNPGNGGGSLYFARNWGQRIVGNWTQLETWSDPIRGTCGNVSGQGGYFFVAFVP